MKKIVKYSGINHKRLDLFTKENFPYLSRAQALEFIDQGLVNVNGKREGKGYKLIAGDKISFNSFPKIKDTHLKGNSKIPLKIIYEDSAILAFDKPRGLPTHPNSFKETDTLANAIAAKFPEMVGVGNKKLECGLIHRLDNFTSGVILAAKNDLAFKTFKILFRDKKIIKEYIALVIGHPKESGDIESLIIHDPKNKRKMKVLKKVVKQESKKALKATTNFILIKSFKNYSLIRLTLASAVTHQIRVHMTSIGHPLAGDRIYQNKQAEADKIKLDGHFLHASSIQFIHPFTKTLITIESPLNPELKKLLETLA